MSLLHKFVSLLLAFIPRSVLFFCFFVFLFFFVCVCVAICKLPGLVDDDPVQFHCCIKFILVVSLLRASTPHLLCVCGCSHFTWFC